MCSDPRAASPVPPAVSSGRWTAVFVENKLAVVGVGVIVFMVLFCFVGPHLYQTNQTNAQLVLQNSTQRAAGERTPAGHRRRPASTCSAG